MYYAEGGVCLAFHDVHWPGFVAVHIGVMPEAWGGVDDPVRRLIAEMRAEYDPARVIAWINEDNRAAIALARRTGFAQDGKCPGVVMMGI